MGNYAFDYPAVLTNKAWQKNKGVVAKLVVGKTDVGAALTVLEGEFGRSQFGRIAPFAGADPLDFQAHVKDVVAQLQKSAAELAKKAKAVATVAAAAAAVFEKSATVPASATKYAKSIVAATDSFAKSAASYPDRVAAELHADFHAKVTKTMAAVALHDTATKAEGTWKTLMADIKQVEGTPTVAQFSKVFHGDNPARMMTTMCKMWDQMVAKNMPTLAKSVYAGTAMNDYFKLPCLADVANEANSAASNAIRKHIATSGQEEAKAVTNYMLHLSSSALKVHELIEYCKEADRIVQAA